jgi:hypothetical protein
MEKLHSRAPLLHQQLRKQFPETFPATCDSIVSQGISLGRIALKRIVGFLLLASAPTLFISAQRASAMESASQNSASSTQAQASNPASSHDRHHRRHSNSKHHRHHHKASVKH